MSRLKIFLSYSHNDGAIQFALSNALEKAGFEVRTDTEKSNTPELYRAISTNINWSDVVIPIITRAWLESHECRDETLRAHERRKPIVTLMGHPLCPGI
jgi:TIR domain